jgi:hypothetical protein
MVGATATRPLHPYLHGLFTPGEVAAHIADEFEAFT